MKKSLLFTVLKNKGLHEKKVYYLQSMKKYVHIKNVFYQRIMFSSSASNRSSSEISMSIPTC